MALRTPRKTPRKAPKARRSTPENQLLWTVRDSAEALGQHPQTTRALLLSGVIPLVRLPSARAKKHAGVSNRILVRKADVLRLISDSTERA
jgi:hypothetical protein